VAGGNHSEPIHKREISPLVRYAHSVEKTKKNAKKILDSSRLGGKEASPNSLDCHVATLLAMTQFHTKEKILYTINIKILYTRKIKYSVL
jgi:hypothetical protein